MRPLARLLAVSLLAAPGPLAAEPPSPFSERWPADQWAQAESGKAAPRAAGETRKDQPVATQPAVATQQALYLIRSTLLTLNDANRSGNYTVLRDLAAPGFQAKNSAADLARIFADLRERRFDLFAVALMAPQLAAPPQVQTNGMLRLAGHFPTQPLRIEFDMLFANVEGQWRLFGLAVATPKAPAPQAGAPPAAAAPKPQKK